MDHYPRSIVVTLSILIALTGSVSSALADDAADGTLRVLIVGNSQTYTNDLDDMLERFSLAAGVSRPVTARRITRGDETFHRHVERSDDRFDEGAPLRVIAEHGWDVVILQENTKVVARSSTASLPYARRLVDAVRAAGAKPLFYMTWAYRDQPEMFSGILRSYCELREELGVEMVPVTVAWRLAGKVAPQIDLFDPDGIHPSPAGSYLAASMIFAKLYGRTPVGVAPTVPSTGEGIAKIDAAQARRLQEIAWQTHQYHAKDDDGVCK